MSGKGKITITGKNILKPVISLYTPFVIKAKTVVTFVTNGVLCAGGSIKFTTKEGGFEWFGLDANTLKGSRTLAHDVIGFTNLTVRKDGLKICLTVGDNDEYEDYKEQVIIAPPDSAQLKTIHTYYHTTTLSSESEISVEYIADTEAYIENKIKENIN